MKARHPMGVLHSFSIKNTFYDKIDLRLFYFRVTIDPLFQNILVWNHSRLERIKR